jgi:FtsZ-binding cell division protein ZapB
MNDLEQIENAGDFLYRKCMEYIDTITKLTLEVAELKHQLALERIKRLDREHDEC